jgi:hypothetical protein
LFSPCATVISPIALLFAMSGTAAAATPSLQVGNSANASPLPASSHSWKIVRSANRTDTVNYLDAVACSSSTRCEAVGYYNTSSNVQVPLAEGWNGTRWAVQTTPNPTGAIFSELNAVACLSATNCEAVGDYQNSSGVTLTLAERWS